jgi:uncharacterized protein (DUF58 family)
VDRAPWISNFWISLPAILAFLGIVLGSTPLIGFAAFIFLAGLVAKTWSRHVFDRVSYERRIPENRAYAGENVALTLRLVNDKLLPIPWIDLREPVPEGVLQGEKHLAPAPFPNYVLVSRSTHLGAYERVTWPLEFRAMARGYYKIGPARFESGDVFGLFPAEREEPHTDAVIIYPKVYTLPELGLPAERPFGEHKGRVRIFEDPGRIAGLRDYRPGDPMRRIDWKASARRQALQSKVYEPSSTLHLLLAVNVHTLDHSWEGYIPEQLERVLSVGASVASYGFQSGYAIGLTANGAYPTSDRPMRIPVGRRSDQLARVLEALAVVGPLTLTPLETVLDRESQALPYGATVVCVTARINDALAASLRHIAEAGHAVTVLSLALDNADLEADLGRVQLLNLSNAIRSLEARDAEAAAGTAP